MEIHYRKFKQSDIEEVKKLIKCFYQETPGDSKISDKKIIRNFSEFTAHPEKGTIIVFESEKLIVGYAILFRGWSNEHRTHDKISCVDEIVDARHASARGASISGICERRVTKHGGMDTICRCISYFVMSP